MVAAGVADLFDYCRHFACFPLDRLPGCLINWVFEGEVYQSEVGDVGCCSGYCGWSWYWVGTHRVEFLLENMNGASPLFQLSLLLPLIQSADGQNPGDHAGTRVFPLVWQKKDLLFGVDMQNIQFKLPSFSL